MKVVTLSAVTYHRLKLHARNPSPDYGVGSVRNADGSWTIEVRDEVYERVERMRQRGESFEAAVVRALKAYEATHGKPQQARS